MIQRFLKLNNLINRAGFYRSITSIQSLYNSTNNLKSDDDDISEDIIKATRKFERKTDQYNPATNYLINTNVIYRLRYLVNCTEEQAEKMLKENPHIESIKKSKLKEKLDLLFNHDITSESIVENPFLLTMEDRAFLEKFEILKRFLNGTPFSGSNSQKINDIVPLLQVSKLVLTRASRIQELEASKVPYNSRIYFLSKELNVEPALVSKYFATHMFMFGIPFKILQENLETLLKYNIEPIHILRDLWVFKYDTEKLKERFELCKHVGRGNLRPWMVRCKMEVLEHSNKIYMQNKNLLGENTIIDYLSKRLGYDAATMKLIASRHPSVLKCRVTKIKEVLDYLLDEAKYQPHEIANVIRVLTHSLETTKQRLNELNSLGCKPTTLTIVCRSQNEYNKFLQDWIEKREMF